MHWQCRLGLGHTAITIFTGGLGFSDSIHFRLSLITPTPALLLWSVQSPIMLCGMKSSHPSLGGVYVGQCEELSFFFKFAENLARAGLDLARAKMGIRLSGIESRLGGFPCEEILRSQ